MFLRSLFIIRKILLISNFYCTNMLRKTKSAVTVITYLQQQRGQISGIAFSFVELCFVEMHRKLVKTLTSCKRKYSLQIVSVWKLSLINIEIHNNSPLPNLTFLSIFVKSLVVKKIISMVKVYLNGGLSLAAGGSRESPWNLWLF